METHHITCTVVHNGNLLHMHEHAHAFVHTNYCSCSNQDRAVGDGAAGAAMQFFRLLEIPKCVAISMFGWTDRGPRPDTRGIERGPPPFRGV